MFIRAKLRDITRDDVIEFARDNGIRRPDAIIRDVVGSLKQFRSVALKHGVAEEWIGRVEDTLSDHLKAWGELNDDIKSAEIEINGHIITNMHIDQTYKGNYHLYASIDGNERKFVVGKNKEEYLLIEKIGLTNISDELLKSMVEKYFKL